MKDQLSKIDNRILQLKQKKEKIQTQQALIFLKESQKILGDKFSSDLAIHILSHAWKSSSDPQKKEWEKEANVSYEKERHVGGKEEEKSFRNISQSSRNKAQKSESKNPQS